MKIYGVYKEKKSYKNKLVNKIVFLLKRKENEDDYFIGFSRCEGMAELYVLIQDNVNLYIKEINMTDSEYKDFYLINKNKEIIRYYIDNGDYFIIKRRCDDIRTDFYDNFE